MNDPEAKAFDLAGTSVEIVVSLSSAVIVGLVAFFDSDFDVGIPAGDVQVVVVLMGLAVVFGLLFFSVVTGTLVGLGDTRFGPASVLEDRTVAAFAALSFLSYFAGIGYLVYAFFVAYEGVWTPSSCPTRRVVEYVVRSGGGLLVAWPRPNS